MEDKTQDLDFVRRATLDTIANTEIGPSRLHGFGLFASQAIPADSQLCQFEGQVISIAHYHELEALLAPKLAEYRNYMFMECNYLDKQTLLARPFRTKYSYINHSRTPNTEIRQQPLRLVALRTIQPGEELTVDYRKEQLSDDYLSNPAKQFL
ncbi:SET domain-containing protein [Aliagarivorans marinus]|uniref:SET domain-containing protein n=1 Tax=Aliagarivorans marinus TaxID=561965 RepID=UPI0004017296|nr:SET domain-containing protein [Aliagarivorans marinus]